MKKIMKFVLEYMNRRLLPVFIFSRILKLAFGSEYGEEFWLQ